MVLWGKDEATGIVIHLTTPTVVYMINPSPSSPAKSEASGESNVSAMLNLKNGRKRAEADLQLLSNRIALLRAEEARALTKITETKNRAKEILVMKKTNESTTRNKAANGIGADDLGRSAKEKVLKAKQEREGRLEVTKKLIEDSRRRVASGVKAESEANKKLTEEREKKMKEQRALRTMEAQKRQDDMRKQRERERAEKERIVQLEYARKMAEEARKTKEAEDIIAELEKAELELIDRLKKTQMMQEKAYETLQKSLDL